MSQRSDLVLGGVISRARFSVGPFCVGFKKWTQTRCSAPRTRRYGHIFVALQVHSSRVFFRPPRTTDDSGSFLVLQRRAQRGRALVSVRVLARMNFAFDVGHTTTDLSVTTHAITSTDLGAQGRLRSHRNVHLLSLSWSEVSRRCQGPPRVLPKAIIYYN